MSENHVDHTLRRNLARIREEIDGACANSQRSTGGVTLIAVTKYAKWPWVEVLSQMHAVFGENRPQQLAERQPCIPHGEWHLIGQLQRNKAGVALQHAAVIHSVDSVKLLNRIARVAQEEHIRPKILLQVNVSGEQSKSGFRPDELRNAWSRIAEYHATAEIIGLMTMAPATDNPETARPVFRDLAQLQSELKNHVATQASAIQLNELSMGMSSDFQIAVEEGATMVRIGSRLFEDL